MDDLVMIINLLQDVFSVGDCTLVDLPQIVVLGTQSSGKSSVLEHLIGKSFLPRGTGIVTRCPLILQMLPATGEAAKSNDYAIFQHDKTKVFTDCQLIRNEIEKQTIKLAGSNKGICRTPIILKMFSSSLLNLTLVDLPGITKVPVGDQPHDIENQTRRLILEYIMNPNSLILAVIPANVDMAASESLKMAKRVDPEGARTLAVVTKLDLMDDGTDAWEILTGKIIPVKLGIIGVVNRSQKEIQDDKSIDQSLRDERKFFKTHYAKIADHHGCPYLANKVQSLLVSHIRSCFPKLRETVDQKLAVNEVELRKLGNNGNLDKSALLLSLIKKFSDTFLSVVKGNFFNTRELYGGARIRYVFEHCFSKTLNQIDPLASLTQTDVSTAVENASGVYSTTFMSEEAFRSLVKTKIELFRSPSLQCVNLVYKEMLRIVKNCLEDFYLGLNIYPKLQRKLEIIVTELLQNRMPITRQYLEDIVDIELAYINTSHPDFLPNSRDCFNSSMVGVDGREQNNQDAIVMRKTSLPLVKVCEPYLPPQGDVSQIQDMITRYFSIVRKTVQDTVPKAIMHFMVNFVVQNLDMELVKRLYNDDADDLLEEDRDITDQRKQLMEELAQLERARDIINTLSSSKMNSC